MDGRALARRAIGAAVHTLRYAIFIPLYALRGLVRGFLNLVAWASLASVAMLLVEAQGFGRVTIAMAGLCFAGFGLAWFYDMLLLKLSPRPIILFQ